MKLITASQGFSVTRILMVFLGLVASVEAYASENRSATWAAFLNAPDRGREEILPDFSYAGYHRGEISIPTVSGPIFRVTDFGAVPNDEKSDREAIQATIKAAEASGGGIVFFPPGIFLVNTSFEARLPIAIQTSHIVLRGSGDGSGGTVIKMVLHNDPRDVKHMYTTPFMLQIGSSRSPEHLANISADSARSSFAVTVDVIDQLAPDMWVTLHLRDPAAVPEFLSPYEPEPDWSRLQTEGIFFLERHQIKKIAGKTVTFKEPLQVPVSAKYGWTIRDYKLLEEIGIEDIRFEGNWQGNFRHHRSALDDGGWSLIRMRGLVNSWVRRVTFDNCNYGLSLFNCSFVSVLEVNLKGTKGHHSVHTREGYGVLFGVCRDTAGHHHGPSVGYRSAGTVYWRHLMQPGQRIDSHSGNPIATLLDRVDGGILFGSGGPWAGLPNHLRHFVLWNFNHRTKDGSPAIYDFWEPGKRDRFLKPFIVGIHGDPAEISLDSVQVNESPGIPVLPESLYEAQLEARLGSIPEWIPEAKQSTIEIWVQKSDVKPAAAANEGPMPPVVHLLNPHRLLEMRKFYQESDNAYKEEFDRWISKANALLDLPALTIVNKKGLPASGNLNDYYSVGPYWWPNPDTPDGLPYIRRDGEVNPERDEVSDRPTLQSLIDSVFTLAVTYFLTQDEAYSAQAAKLLRVFFLEQSTRMNPHLRYSQAIPGITDGRGIGIIDAKRFPYLIDAASLLSGSIYWRHEDEMNLRAWFHKYTEWVINHPNGQSERAKDNNHGTAYDLQVVVVALFAGREDIARNLIENHTMNRIRSQINDDGAQPLELRRTQSWNYVTENLENFYFLALLAKGLGIDLWEVSETNGKGLKTALDFLLPYLDTNKNPWPYAQITSFEPKRLRKVLQIAFAVYGKGHYGESLQMIGGERPTLEEYLLMPIKHTSFYKLK